MQILFSIQLKVYMKVDGMADVLYGKNIYTTNFIIHLLIDNYKNEWGTFNMYILQPSCDEDIYIQWHIIYYM